MPKKLKDSEVAVDGKVQGYYHLYLCKSEKCFKAENPNPGSQHLRAVHVSSSEAVEVHCIGCGEKMVIAQHADETLAIVATEQPPLDDAVIDAENEAGETQGKKHPKL
jgi:hypothetical protein